MPTRPLLAAALALLPAAAAAEVSLWQFVQPDAKIVAGLDLQKMKASPTARMFERQMKSLPGARFNSGGAEIFALVDRLLLSSAGSIQAASPQFLVAIEGRMDRATLKKSLAEGMAVERFKGVDLLVPPRNKNSDMVVAILNEKQGLMGDRRTVEAAVAAFQAGPGPAPEGKWVARAKELSAKNEFWMIGAAPPQELMGGALPAGAAAANDIEAFEIGLSLQRGLGLQFVLTMTDAEAARRVLAQVNGPKPPVLPPGLITDVINGLRARGDKNSARGDISNVRIDLDVPLAKLEKGVQEFKTQLAGMQNRSLESFLGMGSGPALLAAMKPAMTASAPALPTPPPAAPPKPQKRTIRIVGLDEGDKEVTYTTGARPN
jgi:hypothetical protein